MGKSNRSPPSSQSNSSSSSAVSPPPVHHRLNSDYLPSSSRHKSHVPSSSRQNPHLQSSPTIPNPVHFDSFGLQPQITNNFIKNTKIAGHNPTVSEAPPKSPNSRRTLFVAEATQIQNQVQTTTIGVSRKGLQVVSEEANIVNPNPPLFWDSANEAARGEKSPEISPSLEEAWNENAKIYDALLPQTLTPLDIVDVGEASPTLRQQQDFPPLDGDQRSPKFPFDYSEMLQKTNMASTSMAQEHGGPSDHFLDAMLGTDKVPHEDRRPVAAKSHHGAAKNPSFLDTTAKGLTDNTMAGISLLPLDAQ